MKKFTLLVAAWLLISTLKTHGQICPTGPRVPEVNTYTYMNWLYGGHPDPSLPTKWEAYTNLPNSSGSGFRNYVQHPLLGEDFPQGGAGTNIDLYPIQAFTMNDLGLLDYTREQGWEFVIKKIGQADNRRNIPIWIFYNKYTARLRVYACITKADDPGFNTGSICMSFLDGGISTNLFAFNSSRIPTLESYKDYRRSTNQVCTSFTHTNQDGEIWAYGDFLMAYDPCTCRLKLSDMFGSSANSDILVEISLTKVEKLNSQIIPIPKPAEYSYTQATTTNPLFSHTLEEVIKPFQTVGSSLSEINNTIGEISEPEAQNNAFNDFIKLANSYSSLIPSFGAISSSLIGIFDLFSTSSSDATGPAPVMIMNSFAQEGTITTKSLVSDMIFHTPGYIRNNNPSSGPSEPNIPNGSTFYNEVLGNFNVVKAPRFTCRRGSNNTQSCWNFDTRLEIANSSIDYEDFIFYTTEQLGIAINPVMGYDLSKSNIKVALEIALPRITEKARNDGDAEHFECFPWYIQDYKKHNFGSFHITNVDYYTPRDPDHADTVRLSTGFMPIECFSENGFHRLRLEKTSHTCSILDNYLDWRQAKEFIYGENLGLTIKIAARLHHPTGNDYVFVGKFPVGFDFTGPDRNVSCPNNIASVQNIIKPYYQNLANAWLNPSQYGSLVPEDLPRIITVNQNFINNLGSLNTIAASEKIILEGNIISALPIKLLAPDFEIENTSISPEISLIPKDFYQCNLVRSTASDYVITSLCQTTYKSASGRNARLSDSIETTKINSHEIIVYPVPTFINDDLFISTSGDGTLPVSVTLSDPLGRTIPITVSGSDGPYQIRHQARAPGVYTLTVTTSQGVQRKRVVLQ